MVNSSGAGHGATGIEDDEACSEHREASRRIAVDAPNASSCINMASPRERMEESAGKSRCKLFARRRKVGENGGNSECCLAGRSGDVGAADVLAPPTSDALLSKRYVAGADCTVFPCWLV